MLFSPQTIEFYQYQASDLVNWAISQGMSEPDLIKSRHVREFLSEVASRRVTDATVHASARGVKASLNFYYAEVCIPKLIKFEMPRVAKKRSHCRSRGFHSLRLSRNLVCG
jgi:hypothetical protein